MGVGIKYIGIGLGVVGGAAAITAAVQLAQGSKTAISQGGSPWGGPVNWFLARKSVIGYGVKDIVIGGSPLRIGQRLGNNMNAKRAEETVRTMENIIFYDGARQVGSNMYIGYDNGPDAFRHTGASALMNYRLRHGDSPISKQALEYFREVSNKNQNLGAVASDLGDVAGPRGRRMDAQEADQLFDGLQSAHERDSYLSVYDPIHAEMSGRQDFINNAVGREIGIETAAQHAFMGYEEIAAQAADEMRGLPAGITDALRALDPGEQVVMARVVRSIENGQSVTMTPLSDDIIGIHQAPHPALVTDIYDISASGARSVRKMPPHAAGYPQPFRDGEFDPTLERVPAGLGLLFADRS